MRRTGGRQSERRPAALVFLIHRAYNEAHKLNRNSSGRLKLPTGGIVREPLGRIGDASADSDTDSIVWMRED